MNANWLILEISTRQDKSDMVKRGFEGSGIVEFLSDERPSTTPVINIAGFTVHVRMLSIILSSSPPIAAF